MDIQKWLKKVLFEYDVTGLFFGFVYMHYSQTHIAMSYKNDLHLSQFDEILSVKLVNITPMRNHISICHYHQIFLTEKYKQ